MASVSYDKVVKKYGDFTALHGIDLKIADKEFLVLVGPSGCGKSTALRCLAGLEDISSGEIKIDDVVVNDVAPKDRDIAMVFQSYALYPHMSVKDNMAFGLKLRKTPKAEIDTRVNEAASMLGLETMLERKPKQLSGGQRQRVALGRAIVRHPKVFLLDEPLSNLDAKLRVEMRANLSRYHQQLQTTFVYVTHDQVEAMTMATRIAVMNAGYLMQVDSPLNLYERPDNLFVAGFIGSPAMNFFTGKVTRGDSALHVDAGSFGVRIPDQRAAPYQAYLGKEVIFGIRPEDIHAKPFVPPGILESDISSKVDVTELMGNEIFLYMVTQDDKQFIARVDPRTQTQPGAELDLAVNMDNAHIFDPKTEISLAG